MRKVHEQVTQASHDIMEMGDKNKKSDTTTTNAATTSPHTSKSNEVNNTKSSLNHKQMYFK
jgi:heme-binding NEAT domain protein